MEAPSVLVINSFRRCHFGCFPLCQRFQKFRLEVKWEGPCGVLPTGIFGNTPRSGVEYPGRNFATETSRSILTNRFVALLLFTCVGNSENEQKWQEPFLLVGRVGRKMSFHFPRVSPLASDRPVWHNDGTQRFSNEYGGNQEKMISGSTSRKFICHVIKLEKEAVTVPKACHR